MSSDLKFVLDKVIEKDYKRREFEIEKNLEHFKNLLCEIARAKKWDLAIWVEGANREGYRKIRERPEFVRKRQHSERRDEIYRTQWIPRISTN